MSGAVSGEMPGFPGFSGCLVSRVVSLRLARRLGGVVSGGETAVSGSRRRFERLSAGWRESPFVERLFNELALTRSREPVEDALDR